jgi:site-specific DNA-methyltransferase (adenine-specific)
MTPEQIEKLDRLRRLDEELARTNKDRFTRDGVTIHHGDVSARYGDWEAPVCIVADGPYGVSGYEGDLPTSQGLAEWYEPHVAAWSAKATPATTLWFWNTEIGWATVHPVLERLGWTYKGIAIWNKGIGHIAGNTNTKTLRRLPPITEVCAHYVKTASFEVEGTTLSMKEWLRHEWHRTGLTWKEANKACGVIDAATRKYLTKCHLWYYPPVDAFVSMVAYANEHGRPEGRPYFSLDGVRSLTGEEWAAMRSKFNLEAGITNVWDHPALHGQERLKIDGKTVHSNQKPLRLVETSIRLCTDPGDVVWEPFGGLCTAAIASHRLGRRCFSAEIQEGFYDLAISRLAHYDENGNGS